MIVGAYYGWQNIDTNNAETYFQFIDDFFPGQPFNPPIGSADAIGSGLFDPTRSEEHTSELQSLMRISYAVFCLKKKNNISTNNYPSSIRSHPILLTLKHN